MPFSLQFIKQLTAERRASYIEVNIIDKIINNNYIVSMRTEEYIAEMEDVLFEAIDKKDKKSVHKFVVSYLDNYQRDMNSVAHSIELLAQQMSSFQREVNTRFEAVDKRFESMQREMNARFEAVDKRFEAMDKRFNTLTWFMGISFSFISILILVSSYIAHSIK